MSLGSNCLSIFCCHDLGKTYSDIWDIAIALLTKPLDRKLGWKRSSVAPWLERSNDVFTTFFALVENHKVRTIIIPAANNNQLFAGTFSAKTPIGNWSAANPDAPQSSKAL